jgi:large subunit ribosomal protein L24
MKLKKNDLVTVIAGKDKGKRGKVLKVFPTERKVLVEALNYAVVFTRPTQENPKGGIQKVEGKLHASNVQLICPKCSKSSRIGYQFLADGTKQRTCRRCHEII